jgi:hypothetical protein
MSITHIHKKYKRILSLILGISSILMYLGSLFIIGYVEGIKSDKDNIVEVVDKTLDRQIIYTKEKEKGSVVASKSGKKYYFPWCSGINRIKKENRVYFNTELEAQDNGLTLSKTCI